ncbi:twin-arginine translocation signal domain-containing protein, partial [Streptomyces albidoflavus]
MERRTFLRTTVVGTSAVALGGSLWAGTAHAAPAGPGPRG